ncbi:MAG TPA: HAD family phosphatase [Cyclobacteriaceae bacterium]|nr:HAD family phosphatase [Cyclobacteriaceae bacterium]
MAPAGIKNIIFDLGGVIINLSVEKTHQAFATLSGLPVTEIKTRVHHGAFFNEFEKGLISDEEFRQHLRESLNMKVTDSQLDQAWNAMLLDIPLARIQLLEKLKATYNIFLLSNTNNIHLQFFNGIVRQLTGKPAIDYYFHGSFYSHLVKMSKPDAEIYQHVLSQHSLLPKETIFLDDNKDNLVGANKVGIHTFHVEQPDQIFSLFP